VKLDFSKFKFLAIDDMGSHRDLLKGMLWQAGVRSIDLGVDGRDAVNKIAKGDYDVILCDYNLGDGQDGQQVLEEVMSRKLLSYNTIYVMITAENASNMVRGAMEYSPDDYLIKPISKEILAHRVERLLEKKRAMKSIHDATEKGDLSTAITLCDEITQQHKKLRQELLKLKAELCCKAERVDEAKAIFQTAYDARQPQWAKMGLGRVALKMHAYADAVEHFKALADGSTDCLEAYDYLSKAHEGLEEHEEAEKVLAFAASVSPKALLRQRDLGRLALLNENPDVAMKAYKQAVKLAKFSFFHSIDDYIGLTKADMLLKDYPAAMATISNCRKDFKRDIGSLIRIQVMECKIDFYSDREDKAKLTWDSVKRMLETYKEPMSEVMKHDVLSGAKVMQDDAIAELVGVDQSVVKAKVQKQLKKWKTLNKEGIQLYKSGFLQDAIGKFQQALKGMPDNPGVLLNYVQVLVAEAKQLGVDNETDKVIRRSLKKVKAVEPEHPRLKGLEKAFNGLKRG